ncbi:glycosyltransferase family 2 protein [Calothrix sp. PCC 7507]|uniref:glycosyltransferase family 2 protein n=1 Tax=Calothrix sp. PCC 7507 TaxID=99598 RepID=UPI00029EC504|nr:glycosyltransferase [Calothrix sp. PCC 7507]AFY30868.1 glycosyl transferase family 2 [Calothrix sp. PCC 7507]
MSQIKFSVIVPTYHRNDLLAKCLDCLAPDVQTFSADQYEVIVTDDGYQTTAQEIIQQQYPWAKWVAGPRKGPAANRNNGAKYAQGDWLAFTDDDCLPEPHWLEAYAEATKGSSLALEGAIYPLGNLNQDLAECPVNTEGGLFWSANIALQQQLFESISGFDSNYLLAAHEDQDLKIRVEKITKINFVPGAKLYHPVRVMSLKNLIARIPKQSANWAYHVNKHQIVSENGGQFLFTLKAYRFYLVLTLRNMYGLHFKKAIFALCYLIFGLPINWFYILQNQKNSSQIAR